MFTETRYHHHHVPLRLSIRFFFFFNDPATTEIYTLSLHDALPISIPWSRRSCPRTRASSTPSGTETAFSIGSRDRKSTRLNSSHQIISYAVFCLKKKKTNNHLQSDNTETQKHTTYPFHM